MRHPGLLGLVILGVLHAAAQNGPAGPPAPLKPAIRQPVSPGVVRASATSPAGGESFELVFHVLDFRARELARAGLAPHPLQLIAAVLPGSETLVREVPTVNDALRPRSLSQSQSAGGASSAATSSTDSSSGVFRLADPTLLERLTSELDERKLVRTVQLPRIRAAEGRQMFFSTGTPRPVLEITPTGGLAWSFRKVGTSLDATVTSNTDHLRVELRWRSGVLDLRPDEKRVLGGVRESRATVATHAGDTLLVAREAISRNAAGPGASACSHTGQGECQAGGGCRAGSCSDGGCSSADCLACCLGEAPQWLALRISRVTSLAGGSQASSTAQRPETTIRQK